MVRVMCECLLARSPAPGTTPLVPALVVEAAIREYHEPVARYLTLEMPGGDHPDVWTKVDRALYDVAFGNDVWAFFQGDTITTRDSDSDSDSDRGGMHALRLEVERETEMEKREFKAHKLIRLQRRLRSEAARAKQWKRNKSLLLLRELRDQGRARYVPVRVPVNRTSSTTSRARPRAKSQRNKRPRRRRRQAVDRRPRRVDAKAAAT